MLNLATCYLYIAAVLFEIIIADVNVNYTVLFDGKDGKNSLETSFILNKVNSTAMDAFIHSVDLNGQSYQFTAKYYQTYKYFVKCISTVCNNQSEDGDYFYWSFWMNGLYSCSGVSSTVLSNDVNIQMIYSNPNISCSQSSVDDNENQDFLLSNVSYTIDFAENLIRKTSVGINDGDKAIQVMERAVDLKGNSYSFTATYYESYGYFIDCIDSICSNQETSQYWFLYKNGNQTIDGVSNLSLFNGDELQFRYEFYNPPNQIYPQQNNEYVGKY